MDTIEGLVISVNGNPCFVNLSQRYLMTFDEETKYATVKEISPSRFRESRIASVNTFFGINGCGKTEKLLELASGSKGRGGIRFGVLFSRDEQLQLFRGQVLNRWQSNASLTRNSPDLSAIFYSVSPFDAQRRQTLTRFPHIIDASPLTERTLQADPVNYLSQLLDREAEIPHVSQLTVTHKVHWPVLHTTIEELTVYLLARRPLDASYGEIKLKRRLKTLLYAIPEPLRLSCLLDIYLFMHFHPAKGPTPQLAQLTEIIVDPAIKEWQSLTKVIKKALDDFKVGLSGENIIDNADLFPAQLKRESHKTSVVALRNRLASLPEKQQRIVQLMAQMGLYRYRIENLSSGEAALFSLYSALALAAKKASTLSDGPILLLIDEGEMFLHPAWQQRYLSGLLDFLATLPIAPRLHLIIATHSLIIAADSPPFTLFDVRSGEEKNVFGLGADAVMQTIFGSRSFAGHYSTQLFEKITQSISQRTESTAAGQHNVAGQKELIALVNSLADEYLRKAIQDKYREIFNAETGKAE